MSRDSRSNDRTPRSRGVAGNDRPRRDQQQGQGDKKGRGNRQGSADGSRRNAKGRERNRGGRQPRQFSAAAPSQRSRNADPARKVAFDVLQAVAVDNAYANLALPHHIRRARLDQRDAGFATELTYGSLRELASLDAVLAECSDRPLKNIDPPVLDVLRIGTYQLLHMRVPQHAAVDETVALARDCVGAGAGGFVNAVLRRVTERSREEWAETLESSITDPMARLALRYSHPEWVVRALRSSLVVHGRSAEELETLLEADNVAPAVHLAALPGIATEQELKRLKATPSTWVPEAYSVNSGGDPLRWPGVAEGHIRVQDHGSQLAARVLAEADVAGTDAGRWLDMSAGPGGKAALLAAIAAQRGAHLTANEVQEHRSNLVKQALRAVDGKAWTSVTGDGRDIGKAQPNHYDRILLDAPCSGLGALRRRPESRWRKQPSDIPALTRLQSELLNSALDALRPGGVLAYVTCSPHPAETLAILEDAFHRRKDIELLDTGAVLDSVTLTGKGDATRPADPVVGTNTGSTAQLFPHSHGTDAMFMALITKKEQA